jgi:hypothetical protein
VIRNCPPEGGPLGAIRLIPNHICDRGGRDSNPQRLFTSLAQMMQNGPAAAIRQWISGYKDIRWPH